eukprot:TRINITY_DN11295_c0_g4_i1.p1 TRINITY_DN11295_c0_g4~~TRINITY_DN11295_c0_g4_i1.p1  ORF type:complete len:403 (+),score=61.70 TRINITY_DN11295_c0_g4_i1:85-1209(+)
MEWSDSEVSFVSVRSQLSDVSPASARAVSVTVSRSPSPSPPAQPRAPAPASLGSAGAEAEEEEEGPRGAQSPPLPQPLSSTSPARSSSLVPISFSVSPAGSPPLSPPPGCPSPPAAVRMAGAPQGLDGPRPAPRQPSAASAGRPSAHCRSAATPTPRAAANRSELSPPHPLPRPQPPCALLGGVDLLGLERGWDCSPRPAPRRRHATWRGLDYAARCRDAADAELLQAACNGASLRELMVMAAPGAARSPRPRRSWGSAPRSARSLAPSAAGSCPSPSPSALHRRQQVAPAPVVAAERTDCLYRAARRQGNRNIRACPTRPGSGRLSSSPQLQAESEEAMWRRTVRQRATEYMHALAPSARRRSARPGPQGSMG